MEIRDVIYGTIPIEDSELPILDSMYFQRLRQIKQLGFSENSFPSTTHNRYVHSLGCMQAATQALDSIFSPTQASPPEITLSAHAKKKFRSVLRLAALLHDIGHGPLSHTTEFAMPPVSELQIPGIPLGKRKMRKATHEDYTLKILLDSPLSPLLENSGSPYGFGPTHIACLLNPELPAPDSFFIEQGINFRPILEQLISSELDADRMDYLRRDSLHAGVSYGQFDFNWLVGNLTATLSDSQCYLCLQHRALYTFEDFLLSRFHMFLMVYFHHKSVIFDEMLAQYLGSPECTYRLPSDIEAYCEYTDSHLYSHLYRSSNPWARRIAERKPYRMLIELHSGIPASKPNSAERSKEEQLFSDLKETLQKQNIHFLSHLSTSELSKYFRRPAAPIYVRYDNHFSPASFIPLEQCTDLFQKYEQKRWIKRLYVSPENWQRLLTQRQASI
ncbi:MAG: HD domain-containing protein [Bdellovibrionia bacterium]